MRYIALKPLKVGAGMRLPGEEVPEAADWRNLPAYISQGSIAVVSDGETVEPRAGNIETSPGEPAPRQRRRGQVVSREQIIKE